MLVHRLCASAAAAHLDAAGMHARPRTPAPSIGRATRHRTVRRGDASSWQRRRRGGRESASTELCVGASRGRAGLRDIGRRERGEAVCCRRAAVGIGGILAMLRSDGVEVGTEFGPRSAAGWPFARKPAFSTRETAARAGEQGSELAAGVELRICWRGRAGWRGAKKGGRSEDSSYGLPAAVSAQMSPCQSYGFSLADLRR